MTPLIRLLVEAGPLLVFFLVNAKAGLVTGTAVFMAAMVIALGVSWRLERKMPVMPLVGCGFVLVFGGLTVLLNDEMFIKVKPTIVNLLFATALFAGLAMKRNVLKPLMGASLQLQEEGWKRLALRWACFFVLLAILNEAVWRTFPTDVWVSFKVFGILPLSLLFGVLQVPLIMKYQIAGDDQAESKA